MSLVSSFLILISFFPPLPRLDWKENFLKSKSFGFEIPKNKRSPNFSRYSWEWFVFHLFAFCLFVCKTLSFSWFLSFGFEIPKNKRSPNFSRFEPHLFDHLIRPRMELSLLVNFAPFGALISNYSEAHLNKVITIKYLDYNVIRKTFLKFLYKEFDFLSIDYIFCFTN